MVVSTGKRNSSCSGMDGERLGIAENGSPSLPEMIQRPPSIRMVQQLHEWLPGVLCVALDSVVTIDTTHRAAGQNMGRELRNRKHNCDLAGRQSAEFAQSLYVG